MDLQNTIEFLLQNQANHDAKIAFLLQNQAVHDVEIGQLRELQKRNEMMLAQVVESIDSLARIAHVHEQRITGLEGGPA